VVRYAFGALAVRQVDLTHSKGNMASRRIAEKLRFQPVGVELAANPLPGGRMADRFCYVLCGTEGLPPLDVHGVQSSVAAPERQSVLDEFIMTVDTELRPK
jgi:hypothetical protein